MNPMEGQVASRRLGRTGLSVPALALGMMTLGREADESMSHALLPACLDAGINFFDCANIHGLGKADIACKATGRGPWLRHR